MAKRSTSPRQPETTHAADDGPSIGMGSFDDSAAPGTPIDPTVEPAQPGNTAPTTSTTHRGRVSRDSQFPPYPVHGVPDSYRDWIHPATDQKGHDAKLNLRIQPLISRQLELCIVSKHFPYRTVAELVRHALYLHVQWLHTIQTGIPSVMAQVDAINELVRDEEWLLEQHTVLAKLLTACQQHLALGDFESAQRSYESALHSITKMPPGSWRDSYKTKFLAMFKYKPALSEGAK